MKHSPDDLPPALSSLWRTVKLGYRAEPRGLLLAFTMTIVMALPDALIALWLKFLADGFNKHDRHRIVIAALGLAASATATWFLKVVFDRVQRRFRDKISVALEAHVATLQASVATIEHHERPEYLDRLSVLRDQVFTLDHLFMSLFSTMGWIVRLAATLVLLVTVSPLLVFLPLFAIPIVITATWRPGIERRVQESVAPHDRLAKHLFLLGTTAAAGKELRVVGLGSQLQRERRESWDQWYEPIARTRVITALWHTLAWALFGGAYVGAIVYVAVRLHANVGNVVLVVTAGSRLSQYVGAAVGELGFLRGIWLDSSRRLAWLEDYAASKARTPEVQVPDRITDAIRFEHVSFSYPGTDREALTDVNVEFPAGAVIALVGENGAGKSTLVKLLADMYTPTSGRITVDGVDLARMAPDEWRDHLAGAFQDFYRFELFAQASVGVGDHPNIEERPAVERAIGRAGAGDVIEGLAAGLDTQLGPTWDEGVDVSFGQWQKLALSRGFMREDPLLLVLDEPTAALDAETEHALFERFADAARSDVATNGRVTILVSHRFSTVRMADLIVVLDGARVVEVGTHEELIARAGQYAELYAIQAAAYR
ncbi:MAG: ATP-binding cassette, subfamily bacterial [Actinomycetota bacterium]|nr:ATP-binding cassette, subfamily bacterial [Actinomycetota bacterium]